MRHKEDRFDFSRIAQGCQDNSITSAIISVQKFAGEMPLIVTVDAID
jgi:hypothetical protein